MTSQSIFNKKTRLSYLLIALIIGAFLLVTWSCNPGNKRETKEEHPDEKMTQDTTLIGDYVCLPHRGVKPGQPTTAECAFGLQADDGKYYALNLASASQPMINLQPGDWISARGTLSSVAPTDEQYRSEADILLTVTGAIEKVTYPSGGFLYSSELASKEIFVEAPKPGSKIDLPLTVKGRVNEEWLSQGQWGPKGTMRLMLEDENGMQVAAEATVTATGGADGNGFVSFKGRITIGEHTQLPTGYVVIYQSNFSKRREYVKVPVRFR